MEIKDAIPCIVHDGRMEDEIGYHSSRALAELDRARGCLDLQSARRYLRLAGEHLECLRILRDSAVDRRSSARESGDRGVDRRGCSEPP